MISLPILEVHELELSSVCNLACKYCPHPSLRRPKAHIDWPTFIRSLEHVEHYCNAGTQGELSITGIGEAILHPDFPIMMHMCRAVIGVDRLLVCSTNGVALTDEHIAAFKATGTRVYVSLHRPEVATTAAYRLRAAGVEVLANHAFVDSSINWAGQVDWHVSAPAHPCDYLGRGWAVIRENGNVDACCQDAHDVHPIGSVWDALGSWKTHVNPLCASCHLIVPKAYQEQQLVRTA